jgi:hypothetical protein
MKYIFLLLLTLMLCTCSGDREETSVVTAFGKTGKLTANVHKMPVSILLPRFMMVANDELFVYKEKEDKLFEIFHLPDGNYLCNAGVRGQGPDDFLLLDTRSFQPFENGFKVVEAGTNRLKTVVFENNQMSVSHAEKVFDNNPSHNGFYPLADSTYLTFGDAMEANEYALYDIKTGALTKAGDYPQWISTQTIEPGQMLFIYIKSCVVHPNGKKFAAFYSRFKRIRFYDKSVNLLHEVDVRTEPYSTNIEDNYEYFIGQPQIIGNYIYVLCSNSKENDPESATSVCELQVWDWDGNPIACYRFDRKISLIAMSKKYGKIYALDRTIDDELYIYDIPKLK